MKAHELGRRPESLHAFQGEFSGPSDCAPHPLRTSPLLDLPVPLPETEAPVAPHAPFIPLRVAEVELRHGLPARSAHTTGTHIDRC